MKVAEPAVKRDMPLAYRPDIDGLRAVAILSVVCFHAFPNLLHGGFVGVDIFFVISGFLISSIIFRGMEKNTFSFTNFYLHRIKRIFPALALVLTTCFIVGWFSLLPDEYKQLGKHMAAGAGFVQNFVLWKESGYFDVASDLKPLLHLWSLSVEEQFYLFYPLLAWAIWRSNLNMRAMVLVLMVISFGLNVWWIHEDASGTFYHPATRVWELLAGATCALATTRLNSTITKWLSGGDAKANHILSGFGLALIVAALGTIDRNSLFPGWWALLPVTGAALLVLSGPQAWVNRHILGNRLMVWVGLISYPLYLWHWPLLSFAHIITATTPSSRIRMAAVALSFLLAWLTYRLLEKPIRFGRNTWAIPVTLVLVLAAVGYIGYNDFERNGLSFRLPSNYELEPVFTGNADPICQAADGQGIEFCRQSKAGKPTIFLLGDSHAWHLFDGLTSASSGTKEIITVRSMGACLGFSGVSADPKRTDCLANKNRIFSAATSDDIRTVVISARWDIYFEPSLKAASEQALREILTRLTNKGKRIVFVLDIPILEFHPKYCLDIHLPLRPSISAIGNCAISRQAFDEKTHDYREIVTRILKDFPQVQVFDSATKLCDDRQCPIMQNGKLLYRDYDHLSVTGSEYIAKWLEPLILQKPH
ncbi:acyltransferase family protein [Herbaspirillum sp.]|uniref:acyltransferase family protein n=1 Tax=Herbaspirillum sp. TaxID=1890675 RepID=UPI001B065142|nr:acyltransferase family protein [Herbaspirillum sp.]MBO9536529.1 acyltransferase [Herbaspirillum sp.]